MKKKSELKSGRQTRQFATISEFTTDIRHVSGKENVVADALLQAPSPSGDPQDVQREVQPTQGFLTNDFRLVNAIQPGLDCRAIAAAQRDDPDIQNYRTAVTNLHLEDVPFEDGSFTLHQCSKTSGAS